MLHLLAFAHEGHSDFLAQLGPHLLIAIARLSARLLKNVLFGRLSRQHVPPAGARHDVRDLLEHFDVWLTRLELICPV